MRIIILNTILILSLISCIKQDEPESAPTVVTLEAQDVKLNSFKLSGNVTNEGFNATKDRGFVWSSINPNPSVSDNKISVGYGKGQFEYVLEKLVANTTYYFKAYASNDKGTSYGELKIIKTADYSLPTLTTDLPKNITYTSAELGGNVIDEGGIPVSEKGICLAAGKTPTIDDIKIPNGKGIGPYANIVIKLLDGTNYFVRSYAINSKGIGYGNEQNFSTNSFKIPTVETGITQNITATFAKLYGNISDDGGTDLIEKGFCLSKSPNPNISDIKVKASNLELGNYSIVITALDPLSKYYVKAYAQNSKGLSYGSETSFSTNQATIPSVTTNDFQEITLNSVRAGVEIASNGGADIAEFGVCLSTSRNPTIYDRKVIFGNSNSSGKMDYVYSLNSNTTYYLRGYAINRIGVAYGAESNFTTLSQMQNSLNMGLVAYFPFNGNANDISENNLSVSVFGAKLTSNRFGEINSAYDFNGKGDFIQAKCPPINSQVSIAFWAFETSQSTSALNPRYISAEICNGGFAIFNNIADTPMGLSFTTNRANGKSYFSERISNKSIWQFITIVYDGNSCSFYVNGVLINKIIGTGNLVKGDILYIAKSGCFSFSPDYYTGKLDDIGIWNRTLTQEEIKFLFENKFK